MLLLVLLLGVKVLAQTWGVWHLLAWGPRVRAALTGSAPAAVAARLKIRDFTGFGEPLPVESFIARIPWAPIRALALALFNALLLLALTALTVTLATSWGRPPAALALVAGALSAVVVVLLVITALLNRLVMGTTLGTNPTIQIPKRFSGWAAAQETGGNLPVYFLTLVFSGAVGFTPLYAALWFQNHAAFKTAGTPEAFTWLYFSIGTIATVGFGDVTPVSLAAQVSVLTQVVCGPLLLAWLLSSLVTTPST